MQEIPYIFRTQKCNTCEKEKTMTEFRRRTVEGGVSKKCKECFKLYTRENRLKTLGKVLPSNQRKGCWS